ncbi:MAG: VWA domain-containing protein [Flaviramulus sp.]|nr:BatA domain-containing protein [Flaviramulus sp.]NNC50194.1 VWA domain-containing protein [Flaviramulus sp.]
MQFKHPEILYALLLLLIPIIIHLFQLRKFQKVSFTNVAFLKEATLQTRKSSRIKKWFILCTRILLLAALVLAFAQPFTSKTDTFKAEKETVIYLDNSFSMQAKGNKGELFKRAIQDVISNVPNEEKISIITNNYIYRNTTLKSLKNELLQLNYSSNKLTLNSAFLKCKTAFKNKTGTIKNLVFISDFQKNMSDFEIKSDSLTQLHLVKLQPVNTNNIAIDSVSISNISINTIELKVQLKNSGIPSENMPISLYNNDKLIAKTSVAIDKKAETIFTLPANQTINGKITIDDANLEFDNTLYFNLNRASKINVLALNANDNTFLKRIYPDSEFNYTSTTESQLNYNNIDKQNLIVLNEINDISVALNTILKQFINQGGSLIVIPSTNINTNSYNSFLANYGLSIGDLIQSEKRITKIKYSNPLYNNGVFEKQVSNFQYPKVNQYYNLAANNISPVLQYEDDKIFLGQNNNLFMFSSALNENNSNFKNSPLIVPTLYNIAKQSFKIPELYYNIGKDNTYEVETKLDQDAVLSLNSDEISIIPKQQYFNHKVLINTLESPTKAATYSINNKNETIKNVSYNYDRSESDLVYENLSNLNEITQSNSISEVFDIIKSETKVNELWKWFVIFALALLIIEMLILKFFK